MRIGGSYVSNDLAVRSTSIGQLQVPAPERVGREACLNAKGWVGWVLMTSVAMNEEALFIYEYVATLTFLSL